MEVDSQEEYNKRRPVMCKFPYSGVTINPDGHFVPCCNAPHVNLGHLSKVESLKKFINSDEQGMLRDKFNKSEWPSACRVCKTRREEGKPALMDHMADKYIDWSDKNFIADNYDVKYLEFTPSNACNASCSTCGSKFSSKWVTLDQEAVRQGLEYRNPTWESRATGTNYSMSEQDYEKILEVIPTVKFLMLKGGEPLADKRNIKLLEKIRDEKIDCKVNMITNLSMMNDKILDLMKAIPQFHMSVSMDGLYEQYNWIRSTDFDDVVGKLNKWYMATGKAVNVLTTMSIYNFFNMEEQIKYFTRMESVSMMKLLLTAHPTYITPHMIPQHMIDELNTKHAQSIWCTKHPKLERNKNLLNFTSWETTSPDRFKENKSRVLSWMNFVNKQRGFNIEDHVPELNKVKTYYEKF